MPDKVHHDRKRHDPLAAASTAVAEKRPEAPREPRHESDAEKRDRMERSDFDRDLRPHEFAGINSGNHINANSRSAYDIKELHLRYPHFSSTDLKSISVLPTGARLEQGATYLDLRHCDNGEFKARADIVASEDNLFVAKSGVAYDLWNRLCGKNNGSA